MAKPMLHKSEKHAIVDRANSTILIAVSVAVFIVVFSGFAAKALISQGNYHRRVISEKRDALDTLEENSDAVKKLEQVYQSFEAEPQNVLGGNPAGDGPLDGDNAKIVLDALPSEYDYPGLSSSLEKLLVDGGYQISAIGGTEDPALQSETPGEITANQNPTPQEIPYPFTIVSSTENTLKLLQLLESSIRPFYIETLTLEGQGGNISADIGLKTFYLPATGLNVSSKVVQ